MKKSSYGEGNVYKLTDKRNPSHVKKLWLAKIIINGKTITAKFPRTTSDTATKADRNDTGYRDSWAWLKDMQRQKEDGLRPSSNTLRHEIKLYLQTYKLPNLKTGQMKLPSYNRRTESIPTIPSTLLDMRIEDIRPSDVKAALNEIANRLAPSGVAKAYDLINATCRTAVADGKIRRNPCDSEDIKRPSTKTGQKEREIFSKEEVLSLLRAARYIKSAGKYHSLKHDYYTLLLFLFTTGIRLGEALGAKWEDIREEGKYLVIHIQRTIDPHWYTGKKGQRINTPKTEAGDRDIPLLDRHLLHQLDRLRKKNPSTEYIFETSSGSALEHHNLYKAWDSLGRETARECPVCHTRRPNDWTCQCGHHVTRRRVKCQICGATRPQEWTCPSCGNIIKELHKTPHTTRHTVATYLHTHDVPLYIIKYVLGHSREDSVTGRYIHIPPNYIDIIVDKLGIKIKSK